MRRSRLRDSRFTRSMTSCSVGILKRPLKRCGRSGKVWTARSVLISASVKSEANQPVTGRRRPSPCARGRRTPGAPDVGRVGDVGLVAGDQVAVLRRHEIGLDVVGAQLDRERVGLQRVLGQIAAGAAMTDDERVLLPAIVVRHRRGRRGRHQRRAGHRRSAERSCSTPHSLLLDSGAAEATAVRVATCCGAVYRRLSCPGAPRRRRGRPAASASAVSTSARMARSEREATTGSDKPVDVHIGPPPVLALAALDRDERIDPVRPDELAVAERNHPGVTLGHGCEDNCGCGGANAWHRAHLVSLCDIKSGHGGGRFSRETGDRAARRGDPSGLRRGRDHPRGDQVATSEAAPPLRVHGGLPRRPYGAERRIPLPGCRPCRGGRRASSVGWPAAYLLGSAEGPRAAAGGQRADERGGCRASARHVGRAIGPSAILCRGVPVTSVARTFVDIAPPPGQGGACPGVS